MPMFPLGTVLLPGQLLPLHVFESRYKTMMSSVIEADPPLFGVVLIERGSEVGGGDTRSDIGTCARILRTHDLEDGRLAIIAGGTDRIRVTRWLTDDPFPQAEVEQFPDDEHEAEPIHVEQLHIVHRRVAALATELGIGRFEAAKPDLGSLSFSVFVMLAESPLGEQDRQRLLAVPKLADRITRFADLLKDQEQLFLMEMRRDAD